MKKIQKWMAAALCVTALTGCSQQAKMSGAVTTDGSTSMEKVIGALGEAFQNENSGVTLDAAELISKAGAVAVH